MYTVILFFLVISVLIVIHELGHFIAAKAFGIRVQEFALGFPPRIASVVRGETRYSINAIPLGGYVKMTGEEDPSDPRSLASRSIRVRITVLTAGVAMNLALSIFLFAVFFTFPPQLVGARVIIASVEEGSPAEAAGIMPGDIILRTDPQFDPGALIGTPSPGDQPSPSQADLYGGSPVDTISDLIDYTDANLGREITLLLVRDSTPLIVRLVPRITPPPDQGPMGVGVGSSGGHIETDFEPSISVIPEAFEAIYRFVTNLGDAIGNIFTSAEGREGLAGPIGIAQVTGEIARTGILPLIGFMGILSLNLAIFNILPIPALDGGRLLFVIIEAVRGGKKIPPEREAVIHLMGFMVLIAFIIFVSFGDVQRLIRGDSILP